MEPLLLEAFCDKCGFRLSPEYALKKKVRWSINSRQGAQIYKQQNGERTKK